MSYIVLMFGQFRCVTALLFHLRDRVLLRTSFVGTDLPASRHFGTAYKGKVLGQRVCTRLVQQLLYTGGGAMPRRGPSALPPTSSVSLLCPRSR